MSEELVGILICVAAAAAVAVRWLLVRRGRSTGPTTIALAVLAGLTHVVFVHGPLVHLQEGPARAPYHYALGAKYYAELGHYGLYRMTLLAADETGAFDPRAIPRVRHLEDYSFVSPEQALATARAERPQRFDDVRWAEFCEDVRLVGWGRSVESWSGYLTDHGYNPPPVRNALPGLLLQHLDLGDAGDVFLMKILDLLLFAALLVACGALCGVDAALLVFIFVMTAWFNESRLVGNYLNYMWLAALLGSMVAVRSERFRTAGALLAVAASFRVFPALLIAGPLLLGGRALLRRRRMTPATAGVLAGFVVTAATLGFVGLSQGGGPAATREFVANIGLHADGIRWDGNKLGLRRALGDTPWSHIGGREARQRRVEEHPVLHYGLLLLLLGLAAAAVLSSEEGERWAIPLGLCAVFALLTLSRYYYLALAVFLIPRPRAPARGFEGLAAALLMLCNAAWFLPPLLDAGRGATFSTGSKAILIVLVVLPAALVVRPLVARAQPSAGAPPDPPSFDAITS